MSGDTIQFYDGLFPQLKAGSYTAQLEHTVSGGPPGPPSWSVPQQITVAGPQFAIDPSSVVSVYPPDGSTGDYDEVLPFLVLSDPSLPWERSLVPGEDQPGAKDPTPWVAVLVVEDSDLVSAPGAGGTVTSGPVGTLLQSSDEVLAPSLTPPDPNALAQTITVRGDRFYAVMPTSEDLLHLAHCRSVSSAGEPGGISSVVIANRLALSPAGETTFRAHLVSLEGFNDVIVAGASLPPKTGGGQSGPKDVRLVSLASWSFTSTAEGAPFETLIEGLVSRQQPSPALTIPASASVPAAVAARLRAGCVPLEYRLPSGEPTLAWYRGPLTPEVAAPLPAAPGGSSDALLIYSATDGVFDVSYAAAWQLGRSLGLADGTFSQALTRYRQAARAQAAQLGQRRTVAHLAGTTAADLLAPNPSRRRLLRALAEGIGERWTQTLRESGARQPAADEDAPQQTADARGTGARGASAAGADTRGADARGASASGAEARGASAAGADARTPTATNPARAAVAAALDSGAEALADSLSPLQAPVASWLAALALLTPVPFVNLVADEAMLPTESIRFFYVDPGWQQALAAGAMSIGIHGSADVALDETLKPSLDAAIAADLAALGATGAPLSGLLLRSALVPAWPTLVIAASRAGQALPTVRRDTLSADVLLCLWSGVPDLVTLAEPYEGLRFGIEPAGVALRDVTTAGQIGSELHETVPVTATQGRIDVAALAAAIGSKLGIPALGAGDLAIQLVLAPERQAFPTKARA